ncbi:MAG: sterol-binding protein [Burkholderiales bacterium]|nr:sterol-binding protein [Burkholderiales bacterium]
MPIETPLVAALNHLLEAEPWARERLAPFEGETVEVRAAPLPALRFAIGGGGWLAPAATHAVPSLAIALKPQALAALVRGEAQLLSAVEVTGNAQLAREALFLLRHLRWEVEEDLARWIGDAPAHRAVTTARGLAAGLVEAARRVAESAVEYAVEERPMLVPRASLAEHAEAVAALRDAVERLEKRIERLEQGG